MRRALAMLRRRHGGDVALYRLSSGGMVGVTASRLQCGRETTSMLSSAQIIGLPHRERAAWQGLGSRQRQQLSRQFPGVSLCKGDALVYDVADKIQRCAEVCGIGRLAHREGGIGTSRPAAI